MAENINIFNLFYNTLVTFIIYEIVPFVLRFILKNQYTTKQARNIAIINSVTIYVLLLLYSQVVLQSDKLPNMIAAYFWGSISYLILSKTKKDGRHYMKIVKKHTANQYSLTNDTKITRDDIAVKDMLKLERPSMTQCEYESMQKYLNDIRKTNEKKQKHAKLADIFTVIIILFLGMLSLGTYLHFNNQYTQLQIKNENLIAENNKLKEECENYQSQSFEDFSKLLFMDNHVVIVPVNTKVYHKYDCEFLDDSSGYVYNPENAEGLGYRPCPNCID